MDWNAMGAIGEVLGAIAVVGTLGYLAVQTRHSVRATQANTRQSLLETDQQFILHLMRDPTIETLRFKQDLSDEEKAKLYYFFICFVRMRESNWLQFKNGGLDLVTWESYKASITPVMNVPNGRRWWRNYARKLSMYDDEFMNEIDDILEHSPVNHQSRVLAAFDGE